MTDRTWWAALLLAFVALLSACAGTGPVPEDHFYRLQQLAPDPVFSSPPLKGVLKVERIDAFGVLRERAVLYSAQATPQDLQRHHYHFWLDAPTDLVRTQLVQYLRDRNVATLVAADYIEQRSDLRLQLELRDFSRQLQTAGGVEVQVALGVVVNQRKHEAPLLVKQYRARMVAADSGLASSIMAFNQGLEQIYRELVDDLVAAGR